MKAFSLLRQLIPKEEANELFQYTKKLDGGLSDEQVPNSPSFYCDPQMVKLQKLLHEKIEQIAGLRLYTTYNYFRNYKNGAILYPHTDRPSCEISISLNLGSDKNWQIFCRHEDKTKKYNLKPGDAILYRGCDVLHWREKFTGNICSQVFLHFVDQNGPFAEWKYDKKNESLYVN